MMSHFRAARRLAPFAAVALAIVVAGSGPAFSAGDSSPSPAEPTCSKGLVLDPKTKTCIKQTSGVLPDEDLARYAYRLTKEDRHDEAIAVLDLLKNKDTPEALNYRGYATRNLGRIDEGISYYLKAVAMDPDYVLVREYLGEAYVKLGKMDLARRELAEIEKRCGTTCEPYEDLDEAIKAAM